MWETAYLTTHHIQLPQGQQPSNSNTSSAKSQLFLNPQIQELVPFVYYILWKNNHSVYSRLRFASPLGHAP